VRIGDTDIESVPTGELITDNTPCDVPKSYMNDQITSYNYICNPKIPGQYLTVQKRAHGYFHIVEIYVMKAVITGNYA
jgi:hypothetical protein